MFFNAIPVLNLPQTSFIKFIRSLSIQRTFYYLFEQAIKK